MPRFGAKLEERIQHDNMGITAWLFASEPPSLRIEDTPAPSFTLPLYN